MAYKTAIILSHHINPDNSLSEETKARVDKSIDMYCRTEVETLTMSGGHADKEATLTHAEAMRLYALEMRVSPEDLFSEGLSLDTIGQAVFSKKGVVVPNNMDKLIVVSHDYHIRRVQVIFGFVYGKGFDIEYVGVSGWFSMDPKILQKERESLDSFLITFDGVTSGRDDDIFNALIERHPLYKNFKY